MEGHLPAGAVWSPVRSAMPCKLATSAPIEPSGAKRTSYLLVTKWCVIPISPRQTVTPVATVLRRLHRPPPGYQALSGMQTPGLQFAIQILLPIEYHNTPRLTSRAPHPCKHWLGRRFSGARTGWTTRTIEGIQSVP